ncbi:MAG: phosphatidylserine decarboxylase, partial [Oceanobacter sp.]
MKTDYKDDLFIAAQYLLPHHLLSRLVGKLASCEQPWVKNQFIRRFMKQYGISLEEAQRQNPEEFSCF